MWKSGKFTLQVGDGRASDIPGAPFHAIHVGAAAPEMPQNLVSALAPGGRLVVPVGPEGGAQVLMVVDKHGDGRVTKVRGQVWY